MTLWTVGHQTLLCMEFCRGIPQGIFLTQGWNPGLLHCRQILFFCFVLVLPLYRYQPISLHPHAHMLSHVIPWTLARQAPLSMDFSRQEYWSGLPFPSPCRQILYHLSYRSHVQILVGYSPWGHNESDTT